ncbi:putative methyltransferase-domain-containing protein [Elsinoe ampelina]|uniref:25S rRNA adenine-N(1) methyltransferase n=1 Tax=Elsinoe ampelina TaxID=302913 RepID=A0A6A6G021_9PEZI|nr:putative methyltransferase-domain-containing protein [Elsinoe ampelina]
MAKSSRRKSLSSGRPGISKPTPPKLSAKAGRTIIRSHHQLNKALDVALRTGDSAKAEQLRRQINEQGGLSSYQHASLMGQSDERGGDSSKVLVDWVKTRIKERMSPLKVLEVGALSTSNACSRWKMMDVTRIDLHSQQPGIKQQDFMDRPLPATSEDRFDIISLSLVLNYVPDKEGRGRMLQRSCEFLHDAATNQAHEWQPCLFLVLPAPCILNSRYMTEQHLTAIMRALGYELLEQKTTSKLHYSLWTLPSKSHGQQIHIRRKELNPGASRNNFSIVL